MKKNIFGSLMVVALVAGSLAHAYPVTRAEEVVAHAFLESRDGGRPTYPRPYHLAMLQRGDLSGVSAFVLSEDTGVRCIVAPCPSQVSSHFAVTGTSRLEDGSVVYQASPISVEFPRRSQFDRQLVVIDHSSNLSGDYQDAWEVRLTDFLGTHIFGGTPKSSFTDER